MALALRTNAALRAPQLAQRSRRARLCITASHVDSTGAVAAWPTHVIVKHDFAKEKLEKKGVFSWPTWSCEVSKFPWSYEENEDCYILEGRVIVTPDGGEPTEIVAGDYCTFPVGMSCEWDVKEPIRKHYNFHT